MPNTWESATKPPIVGIGLAHLTPIKHQPASSLCEISTDEKPLVGRIALYARVSSAGHKGDVDRQLQRLKDYAAAKGYQVSKEVIEIASGLNKTEPKLEKLLVDTSIGTIVVENRDRLTRFGSHYIETLLEAQGRHLEVIFQSDQR